MNDYQYADGGLFDYYQSELDKVIEKINGGIYHNIKRELTLIHSQRFYRHQIRFIDAMGIVSLSIGDYNLFRYGYLYKRFGHVFEELFELMEWYMKCSELHKDICIDDIIIDPITK